MYPVPDLAPSPALGWAPALAPDLSPVQPGYYTLSSVMTWLSSQVITPFPLLKVVDDLLEASCWIWCPAMTE